MLLVLILLFIVLPTTDWILLFRVGQFLGFEQTLGLVLLTGVVGASIARMQGLSTLARINGELSSGKMPTTELAEGLMILFAGAVLICPGFLTDIFGLLLLVPPVRRLFIKGLKRYFESRIKVSTVQFGNSQQSPSYPPQDVSPPGPSNMKYVRNEATQD